MVNMMNVGEHPFLHPKASHQSLGSLLIHNSAPLPLPPLQLPVGCDTSLRAARQGTSGSRHRSHLAVAVVVPDDAGIHLVMHMDLRLDQAP